MSVAFRIGNVGPAGGKPFTPHSKTYKCKCSNNGFITAPAAPGNTTSVIGGVGVFNILDYNLPISTLAANGVGAIIGSYTENIADVHPSGHEEAEVDEFESAQVMSCMYRFTVWDTGTSSRGDNWVFAYKFAEHHDTSDYDFGANGNTTSALGFNQWPHMRMTRGWTWKRFSGSSNGGSIWPSNGVIEIKIPSVGKLTYALQEKSLDTSSKLDRVNPLAVKIASSATPETGAVGLNAHLHWVIFQTDDSTGISTGDYKLDIDYFATVKLTRPIDASEMIDEPTTGAS